MALLALCQSICFSGVIAWHGRDLVFDFFQRDNAGSHRFKRYGRGKDCCV